MIEWMIFTITASTSSTILFHNLQHHTYLGTVVGSVQQPQKQPHPHMYHSQFFNTNPYPQQYHVSLSRPHRHQYPHYVVFFECTRTRFIELFFFPAKTKTFTARKIKILPIKEKSVCGKTWKNWSCHFIFSWRSARGKSRLPMTHEKKTVKTIFSPWKKKNQ